MRGQEKIERAKIFRQKGGYTMRNNTALKRIALVVLVAFFCSTCWASTSWAYYVGGYGPGEYKMTTRSEMGGNKLAAYVVTTFALILGGKYVIDRFMDRSQPINWQSAQVQQPQAQVVPQSYLGDRFSSRPPDRFFSHISSDAIVPGKHRVEKAVYSSTPVKTVNSVQPVSVPSQTQRILRDASYGVVENKTKRCQRVEITDSAGAQLFNLALGPFQRVGIGPLPPERCHVAGYSFELTHYGEEDTKVYEREIERDAQRRKGVQYGWILELNESKCKFHK